MVSFLLAGALAVADTVPSTALGAQAVAAPGARLTLIAKQFKFTEGPAVDRAGNVFFTDQPNDKIWKYSTEGKLTVFLTPSGRANGLDFDAKGNLLACADAKNQLWSISPAGKVTVLADGFEQHRFNGPNDLWVNPKGGGIYFTDPYYQRDYWAHTAPDMAAQNVYYLAPGAPAPVLAAGQLRKPNGIVGTPDGKQLFVADIEANKTYRYQIGPDGRLSNRQLFVEQGSDGMALDSKGNLYLTGQGVTVYSAQGQKIAHIDVPGAWTGNVCFAGKDLKTLFITASEAVYTLPLLVKGLR
ncbi:SMP-30/gluconolactonase/LRE family protein [Hymenobacter nivis]|uniref:SMP-30/gluconolactonase/LRE family protein n=1 Tax=Hymenobacter nivis TaxID=1850093 RepID=A0A502G8K1_9BACT|nr:SMP-30/gluconolactonase/LRE family protein [Hymenobacter nivis]TPG58238.1 SMP-30/gluconolactonase/LRE family protein [Hymenobacter nivis]